MCALWQPASLYLFLERMVLQEGMKQLLTSPQFLFLLFLGVGSRCARSLARYLRLLRLALLKIYHKFFHQQVDQFFPQLFQLLSQ